MWTRRSLGLRHIVSAASSDGSFVACTERKIHHWTDPSRECSTAASSTFQDDVNTQPPPEDGDCFGVLGAKKLLTRTKQIADVAGVQQLAAGDHVTLALTMSGTLFVWGESLTGHDEASPWRALWFLSLKVTRIACGLHHAVVATDAGDAYAWGANVYGQLGLGSAVTAPPVRAPVVVTVPRSEIDQSRSVLDVACGDNHSVLLLVSGELVACGNNWQGQLGIDTESSPTGCVVTPTSITLASDASGCRVYLVSAYGTTTAAVTTQGDVFVWGVCVPSGRGSVCGLSTRWEPQLVDIVDEDDSDRTSSTCPKRLLWHSVAVADGLVVLTQHTEGFAAS